MQNQYTKHNIHKVTDKISSHSFKCAKNPLTLYEPYDKLFKFRRHMRHYFKGRYFHTKYMFIIERQENNSVSMLLLSEEDIQDNIHYRKGKQANKSLYSRSYQ